MRIPVIAISAALATAACSSGPSDEQKADAQKEMQSCMGPGVMKNLAPSLTDVTAQLDGLDAEKLTLQKNPDFTIRGKLPEYEEKSKKGDVAITSKMDIGITFQSVGGKLSASVSGSQLITEADGKKRNNPFYAQTLDAKTEDFKGIRVAAILTEGQGCAFVAQQKLGLEK